MQRLLYLISFVILFGACQKESLQAYSSTALVYFYEAVRYKTITDDSITYSFAVVPDSVLTDTIYLPLRIIGEASKTDRQVGCELIAAASTADPSTFEILPAIIPANSYTGTIPVKVNRAAVLKKTEMRLWIQIINSADFKTGVSDQLKYLIRLNDFLSKPSSWRDNLFGKYSNVKYDLIIKATGVVDYTGLDYISERNLLQECRNALYAYENDHGFLYDENGEPVVFP
ncbi:protein of unknown function [Chitinophaga jiangningensis]|uniref:DUF4843 domain-containing protein n=1 Tax=Chitinophaga jiangningensis TaxID=1419482 RepID=A0A1M7FJ37_9BACT|nr:DUF4843 domain-containing protein [Chitinophaga jiangningensis]SHM03699.1 protein of unknown function [Chitinophaga jiangningensis]